MYCANCGKENDDDSKHCIYCGKPLTPSSGAADGAHGDAAGTTSGGATAGVAGGAKSASPEDDGTDRHEESAASPTGDGSLGTSSWQPPFPPVAKQDDPVDEGSSHQAPFQATPFPRVDNGGGAEDGAPVEPSPALEPVAPPLHTRSKRRIVTPVTSQASSAADSGPAPDGATWPARPNNAAQSAQAKQGVQSSDASQLTGGSTRSGDASQPIDASSGSGDASRPLPFDKSRLPIVAAVLATLAVVSVIAFAYVYTDGFTNISNPYASPTTAADPAPAAPSQTASASVTPAADALDAGVPVRDALNDYSWTELKQISEKIASTPDSATAIAARYNLCGANGELMDRGSKDVILVNGTQLHARIIGFNHDDKVDGGKAGITFLFDEAVGVSEWNQTGYNAGGWQSSTIRSWLSNNFFTVLPDDLKGVIASVDKQTNNKGGVDSGTLGTNVVTQTPDKLWLPSIVEVTGTASGNESWSAARGTGEFAWCNDIVFAEGSQYALFAQAGVSTYDANSVLVRAYEGQPREWWFRTSNPHILNDTLNVAADGNASADASPIHKYGVVPGFCL